MKTNICPVSGLLYLIVTATAFLFTGEGRADPLSVMYPRAIEGDIRAEFGRAYAEMALQKTSELPGDWSFQFTKLDMERSRMEFELAEGKRVNLLLLPGSTEADAKYRRINHQLDKGLSGLRILLIRQDRQHLFNLVDSLEDLHNFSFVSGSKWNITNHMERAGLHVVRWPSYRAMFALLAAGRVDGFGRGATEILSELAQFKTQHPDVIIESSIAMQSNLAFYLYAAPQHAALAHRLDLGLRAAKEDGSFERMFRETFGKGLASLNLEKRKIINLTPAMN